MNDVIYILRWIISSLALTAFIAFMGMKITAGLANTPRKRPKPDYVEYDSPNHHMLEQDIFWTGTPCTTCGMDDMPVNGGVCYWCRELVALTEHLDRFERSIAAPTRVMRSHREDAALRRAELEVQIYADARDRYKKQRDEMASKWSRTFGRPPTQDTYDEVEQYQAILNYSAILKELKRDD